MAIKFNSSILENVAPVMIEDIHISPVSVAPVVRQRIGAGQDFIRMTEGTRTITITFALPTDDIDLRFQQLQAIIEWAKPYECHALELPMYPDKHFDCICTGLPDPSYRQWWEPRLRLVFTTFDNPYLTDNNTSAIGCNGTYNIVCTATPLMKITRTLSSAATNQSYSGNGNTMTFTTIPAGNLIIDLNRQTATVNGQSIMQYMTPTSKFILPKNGSVRIDGTGQVSVQKRWI